MTNLNVFESRKLASLRTVEAIEPIEGADVIELAVVGGWKVVTKKGEFKIGDLCVYIEIDAFLCDGVPAWQFLVDKQSQIFNGVKGHKLRTIKLRGQISQGLILPTSAFPILQLLLTEEMSKHNLGQVTNLPLDLQEELSNLRYGLYEYEAHVSPQDLNLNKLLNVVKWEPMLSAQLSGLAAGLFPSFLRKTDQERAQNLRAEIFDFEDRVIPSNPEFNRAEIISSGKGDPNAQYEVTLKLDGSSMTVFARKDKDTGEIQSGVCSRNLEFKVDESNAGNSFIRVAIESNLLAVVQRLAHSGVEIAVQGELVGPGIQGNQDQLHTHEFYVFDIREGCYLSATYRKTMFEQILSDGAKIKHVPVLHSSANLKSDLHIETMDQLLAYADGPGLNSSRREGLVFKRTDGQFSFKVISNAFLSKQKD
jgi:RNA ligase (TIGR02306 family)